MDGTIGPYHLPDYSQYPWKHVNEISQIFKDSPVLLALELTSLAIYAVLLVHALKHRKVGTLAAATLAGAVNEVAFTTAPMVNNFWHAQAWLMLTPRLPIWQLTLYGFLLYTASQSAERLQRSSWHRIGRAAAAGLIGLLLLFPLDAVCVKFVAYTWHSSDPLLANRLLGVALGNVMFAAAFPGCFAGLLLLLKKPWWWLIAGLLSTPAMVLVTTPFSMLLGSGDGLPSPAGVSALLVALVTIVAAAAAAAAAVRARPAAAAAAPRQVAPGRDWTLALAALVHFAVLLTMAALADPAGQKSVGFHQPMTAAGMPCRNDTDLSASGHARRVFLCPAEQQQRPMTAAAWSDFDPTCDPAARIDEHWYAVCGRAFDRRGSDDVIGSSNRKLFVVSLTGFACMALASITFCQMA